MIFSPNTVVANDLLPSAEETQFAFSPGTQVQPETTETPAIPASEVKPTSTPATQTFDAAALLAAINQDREAREKAQQAVQERETYKTRAEKAEAALADFEKAKKNKLIDPAGFLRKVGYTDKELALTAEGIMFSLVPEKAPPDHVRKLVEAQRARDMEAQEERERERDLKTEAAQEAAQAAQVKQVEDNYKAVLAHGAQTLPPGTYPASQAWFGSDHEAYAGELFSLARKMSDEATAAGTRADLNPASVARKLEESYATRFARFSPKAAAPQLATTTTKVQTQVQSPATQAETPKTPQTNHGLTEAEIIRRATVAAFGRE